MTDRPLPGYDSLPRNDVLGMNHAWGVFGDDDELGTINLLTTECVVAAAREIVRGRTFNLNLPLDMPKARRGGVRSPYRHTVIALDRNTQDDVLDNFYLQSSTQWDALRHVRAREFGFYNGIQGEDAGPGGDKLGIDAYTKHGIVGRGVLVDVAHHLEHRRKQPLEPSDGFPITPELIDEVLSAQKTELRQGDIMLLRTGYTRAVLEEDQDRPRSWPGLAPGEAMARYIWDLHIAAIAADNPAVETAPGDPKDFLHRRLIPMLGVALGEFFNFEELSEDSAEDGKYTCFFAAVPLNLRRGVGSPGNGIAIK
jgi:kynurenine formamidase